MAKRPQFPDRETRIRRAAVRLFNERGYGSATIEEIAREAGVGVGTIYRRWPDKPALANDVYGGILAVLAELIAKPLRATSPRARFLEIWNALWAYATVAPDAFLFAEGHSHEAYVDERNRRFKWDKDAHTVERVAELGISASPEVAVSMVVGTAAQAIRDGAGVDPDEVGARLWAALTWR